MTRTTRPIGLIACLCLLTVQWSGLHGHADETGYIGGPETSYAHSHVHHEHDSQFLHVPGSDHPIPGDASDRDGYGDARDVSLLNQALVAFKLPLAIVALVFLFVVIPLTRTLAGADVAYRVLSGRHTRWRPPLRAPPQPA